MQVCKFINLTHANSFYVNLSHSKSFYVVLSHFRSSTVILSHFKSLIVIFGHFKSSYVIVCGVGRISHAVPLFAELATLKIDDLFALSVRIFSYKLSKDMLPGGTWYGFYG